MAYMNIGENENGYEYYDFDYDMELKKCVKDNILKSFTNVEKYLIRDIHKNINYGKIHHVMHSLNWIWFPSSTPPTIEEIQIYALKIITNLFLNVKNMKKNNPKYFEEPKNIPYSLSSGGFSVSHYGGDSYKIAFSVVDYDTFFYECDSESDVRYLKKYHIEYCFAKVSDDRRRKIKNILN